MTNLCNDVIYETLNYNEHYNSKFHLINKEFYDLFNKKKYHNSQRKIKKWYLKYTYPYPHDNEWYKLSKRNIVQFYRKYYEIIYLMEYPEFMAKKLDRDDLTTYILNNMNEQHNRKKEEVIRFLNLPIVSKQDIMITGW